MKYWKVIGNKSNEYSLELEDPEGMRSAYVKWDGCVDYMRYYNTPKYWENRNDEDDDYIHICDIDEEIARLQELRDIAKAHFASGGKALVVEASPLLLSSAVEP